MSEKVNRRKFLKIGAGVVAAAAIGGGAYYYLSQPTPPKEMNATLYGIAGIYVKIWDEYKLYLKDNYNINFYYVPVGGGEGLSRLEAEKAAPKCDIFLSDPATLTQAYNSGLTDDIPWSQMSNSADLLSPDLEGKYIGPVGNDIMGDMMYNYEKCDPEPSWMTYIDPKYQNKVSWHGFGSEGHAYMYACLYKLFNSDEEKMFDYLTKLHQNGAVYFDRGPDVRAAVQSGDKWICPYYTAAVVHANMESKSPVKGKVPEYMAWCPDGFSLVKNRPDPEASIELFNLMLGEYWQSKYSVGMVAMLSPNKKVAAPPGWVDIGLGGLTIDEASTHTLNVDLADLLTKMPAWDDRLKQIRSQ